MDRFQPRVAAEPARLAAAAQIAAAPISALAETLAEYRVALHRLAGADLSGAPPPDRSWDIEEASQHLESLRCGLDELSAEAAAIDSRHRSPAERALLAVDIGVEGSGAAATVVDSRLQPTAAGGPAWRGAGDVGPGRPVVSARAASRVAGAVTRAGGPAGFALAGAGQLASDAGDPTLTQGERIARAGAATVVDGGLGALGAAGGAKLGAAAGTLVAPGVGTVAGVVLGGLVGGLVGGVTGGKLRASADPVVSSAGRHVDRALDGWREIRPAPAAAGPAAQAAQR